jgi:hypothetical protein
LWEKGLVREGSTAPPAMVACLNPQYSGSVWVFPGGRDVCTELGLQELPDGYEAINRRFVAMRTDMIERIQDAAIEEGGSRSRACLSESRAQEIATAVSDEHGFDDWTVVASGAQKSGECSQNLTFDDVEKSITIGPTLPGELPSVDRSL